MPHFKLLHPFQLGKLKDCVVLGDQFEQWVSSVGSQRKIQIALSNIYRKFRKNDVECIATSQRFKNLHIRYRELCDVVFKMRRIPPDLKRLALYFLATPCDSNYFPIGAPVKFRLDEVKDLYNTKDDTYEALILDAAQEELLASVPVSHYFAGDPKTTALDELIEED